MGPTLSLYIYIYIYFIIRRGGAYFGAAERERDKIDFMLFSSLLFLIYGVSTVRICRVKNESSSTR